MDILERLRDTELNTSSDLFHLRKDAAAEIERLRAALTEIDTWSRAYPLKVFPEPDMAKAAEVLKAAGMTLDAISASNMRHVVEGVGKIAREALRTDEQ